MKKFILYITFLASLGAYAQQDAQFSQYMFNGLVVNPAYAGSEGYIRAGLFHRSQWVGFDGHPVTQSFSIHSPVLHESVGVGLHVMNDKIGLENKFSLIGSYAYRIYFAEGILSMGLQGGLHRYSLDQSELDVLDKDDQRFYPDVNNRYLPDVGAGFYYKTKDYYVGLSIPHLIQSKVKYTDYNYNEKVAKLSRHYYLTAAYNYKLNSDWRILPSFITKAVAVAPLSVDVTVHTMFKDMVWGGITYRVGDSFNFQIGTQIDQLGIKNVKEKIKIGYAFDLTTSKFRAYNSGTHEIMLIYDFQLNPNKNKISEHKKFVSPRFY